MRRREFDTAATKKFWPELNARAYRSHKDFALHLGDAREVLSTLPSGSVNTCLTSPPYWGVRDYAAKDQIGLESEVNDYVAKIVDCFREVKRLLRPEGTAWLNLGDKYLNGVGTQNGLPPKSGWMRNKQLSMVPFRVALALQEDGWWVRNTMVWLKPNAMPISAVDRLTNQWEPVFLLTRDEYYYFNLDRIRVPHKTSDEPERKRALAGNADGKARGKEELRKWLNSPRHRATIDGLKDIGRRPNAPDPTELASYLRQALNERGSDIKAVASCLGQPFERVRHYFRTDRIGSRLPPEDTWNQLKDLLDLDGTYDEAMAIEYGDNVFKNHPKGRNPGDAQSFSVGGGQGDHFATMPLGLAQWCLSATLPDDGTCLDPFMGHGTTGIAAIQLGGRFVGVDVVSEYLEQSARMLERYETNANRAAE